MGRKKIEIKYIENKKERSVSIQAGYYFRQLHRIY
jgi:hypothetical protein